MWQAGILILYLIHHAHTANDPRCPALNRSVRCKSYLKGHQCQTDTNCHGGKVCCPLKCGKECVIPIPLKPRPGVCPSVPKNVPESCANVFLTSDCQFDADCKNRNQKCCRQSCGNLACTDPIKGNRPGCPVCSNNPGSTDCPLCAHFNQQCNADSECQPGETCCYNPSCGTWCQAEVCRLPKLHGPCRGSYPRYYFNFKTQKCEKFTYGGCLGNANNFESLTECRDKCIDKDKPITKPGECPPNTPGIACALFVRPGDCVDDGSCPGKQKCCLQRCSRNCVDPEPRCGPVCAISCPFGNVLDENNCPICRCKTGNDILLYYYYH
ncbi:unnamed protein product [Mytilus coruscus]|uniref:WFDC3 n=1 Tax=Mytilus coruscus TaxID=42192 RepID=A0A6J8CRM1_MYTCO|nr:unnamed protein product [Mytilus coruscus]